MRLSQLRALRRAEEIKPLEALTQYSSNLDRLMQQLKRGVLSADELRRVLDKAHQTLKKELSYLG